MKKQETVEKRHQQVVEQWEQSRERKIRNLQHQKSLVAEKAGRMKNEMDRLNAEIDRLRGEKAPVAPSAEERLNQHKASQSVQRTSEFSGS